MTANITNKMFCLVLCLLVYGTKAFLIPSVNSPCPDVFQYKIDDSGKLYGNLKIENFTESNMNVRIELAVDDQPEEQRGAIEPIFPESNSVNFPIAYKILFPLWKVSPPQVARILANNNSICSDSSVNRSEIVTLEHSFQVKKADVLQLNNDIDNNNKMYGVFDIYDQFSYHPSPPEVDINQIATAKNKINFNPQIPKGSNRRYPLFTTKRNKNNRVNFRPSSYKNPYSNHNLPMFNIRGLQEPSETKENSDDIFSNFIEEKPADRPYSEICGRPVTTNSLIVNGNSVPKGAYPWLAAIFRVQNTGLNYICSGSLVSDRHIVTAAHCVQKDNRQLKPEDLLVILGKLNIARWVPTANELIIEPHMIHVHPEYTSSSSDADIAIIELSDPVAFSISVRPICLWEGSDSLDLVIDGEGVVAGWGKNENGLTSAEPRQTSLPIVQQEICLRSAHQFQYITSKRTFCAGSRDGSGPCNGDSGGGFVMKRDGIWMLRGIVSMSLSDTRARTCDLSHYIVFTDASKYVSWILDFMS